MREIRGDPHLRRLGAGLALTLVLTYFFWGGPSSALLTHLPEQIRICWSILPNCESWSLPSWALISGPLFMLLTASAAAVGFAFQRTTTIAVLLLAISSAVKVALFLQDYRLMGNYHYMPFWILAAFFLAADRRQVALVLIVGFYFFAGLLKFNTEWLSGAALIRQPVIEGKLLEWATAAVILLECSIVFGLLSSSLIVRRSALAAFVAFHLFSWHHVGFFYPLVMLSLLTFILFLPPGAPVTRRTWKPRDWALPCLFVAAQLWPLLFHPNSAVTGEARILALNMFDAKTNCKSSLLWKEPGLTAELPSRVGDLGLAVRIHCDPQVHWAMAKKFYCPILPATGKLSILLESKTTVSQSAIAALRVDDVCGLDRPPFDLIGRFR